VIAAAAIPLSNVYPVEAPHGVYGRPTTV
jgi:hypothetical protein